MRAAAMSIVQAAATVVVRQRRPCGGGSGDGPAIERRRVMGAEADEMAGTLTVSGAASDAAHVKDELGAAWRPSRRCSSGTSWPNLSAIAARRVQCEYGVPSAGRCTSPTPTSRDGFLRARLQRRMAAGSTASSTTPHTALPISTSGRRCAARVGNPGGRRDGATRAAQGPIRFMTFE